jgi:hypothetical protein
MDTGAVAFTVAESDFEYFIEDSLVNSLDVFYTVGYIPILADPFLTYYDTDLSSYSIACGTEQQNKNKKTKTKTKKQAHKQTTNNTKLRKYKKK